MHCLRNKAVLLAICLAFVAAGCQQSLPTTSSVSLAENVAEADSIKDDGPAEKANSADEPAKARAQDALQALTAQSRDLNAPVTLNTRIGDPAKKSVLIYYANENAPDQWGRENHDRVVEWLRSSQDERLHKIADSLDGDLEKFPQAVDQEVETIQQNVLNSRLDRLSLAVFTNRRARAGEFLTYREGEEQFEKASFQLPALDNPIYRGTPLASAEVLQAALAAVADQFDPAEHQFILITKSHGSNAMVLVPRLIVDTTMITRERLLALAEMKPGHQVVQADGAGPEVAGVLSQMKAEYPILDKDQLLGPIWEVDELPISQYDITPPSQPATATQDHVDAHVSPLGVTKEQYIAVLRGLGVERGMDFPLLFIESCRSQLNAVVLRQLRHPQVNIGRIYTSDRRGLEYQTLDYNQLFQRAAETDTFADAVHQTLFAKYEAQKAQREAEVSPFRDVESHHERNNHALDDGL